MENVLAGRERAAADRVPPSKEAYLRRAQSHKVCILSWNLNVSPMMNLKQNNPPRNDNLGVLKSDM